MNSELPVAVFVYNRLNETKELISRLAVYQPSKIFVIADGPKSIDDLESTQNVRALFDNLSWECDVVRHFASENMGLRQRITTGLDFVFSICDFAIILEDDCHPSSQFFEFVESLRSTEMINSRLGVISGSNFAPIFPRSSRSYFFSKAPLIWGWATSRDVWQAFRVFQREGLDCDTNGELWRMSYCSIFERLEFDRLVRLENKLDTWDIEFSRFIRSSNYLCAIPKVNLVRNNGFGQEATHTLDAPFEIENSIGELNFPLTHPRAVQVSRVRWKLMYWKKYIKLILGSIVNPGISYARLKRSWQT